MRSDLFHPWMLGKVRKNDNAHTLYVYDYIVVYIIYAPPNMLIRQILC